MRRTKIVATIGPACREPETLLALVEAGMDDVSAHSLDVPTVFHDFDDYDDYDDYWTPFLGGQGPGPGYLAALPEEAGGRLRERLRASLPTEPDGSIRRTARASVVQGSR